jgi:hypothetical protein
MFLGKVASLLAEEAGHTVVLFGSERAPEVLSALLTQALSPLTEPLSERLLEADSPLTASEAFGVADDFASRILKHLNGCSQQKIVSALSAIYGGFEAYMDAYGESEGNYLKTELTDAVDTVTFQASSSSSSSSLAMEGDDDLGLEPDVVDVFNAFADRLAAVADSSFESTTTALERSAAFMGGLRAKPAVRSITAAIAHFTKLLTGKVDQLRIASGIPLEKVTQAAGSGMRSSAANAGAGDASGGLLIGEDGIVAAQTWASKLEGQDVQGRSLVPCALKALQVFF